MAKKTLTAQILQRNDTAANWATKNPVAGKGEMCVEIDTGKFKFGDGTTAYISLAYSGVLVKASTVNGNILIDGVETVVYTLPLSTTTAIGGVKSQAAGTGKVVVGSDGTMTVSNVASSDTLSTARTISLAGDATGSTSFDGSANKSITIALVASGVTAGTYTKVTVDAKGRVTAATSLGVADIPTLTLSKISDAGTAASKAVGTAAGNVPILDSNGKLSDSVIPALAISSTFTVSSQTAMLALDAQEGDVAIRTDTSNTYILKAAPASTLANWVMLKTPTDLVSSVNGKTGVVVLTTSDIGEGTNLYWTAARFTAAFASAIAGASVASLSDGAKVVTTDDTLVIDCGNA